MGNRTLGDAVRCWMADCFGFRLKFSCLKFRGSTGTRRWWTAAQACLVALCVLVAWTAVATTYVYDAQGRLVVVTNDAGTSARYLYDKMGNLTQIERLAAGQLAIFSFNPTRGGAGVTVKVRGQGFSTTPSLNTLKFNGVAAAVSAATVTELTTVVPASATTGPITVTVGADTASSPTDFVVDENALPPSITSVSPTAAAVGTVVTTEGQYLYPVANQTTIQLGRWGVPPSTLSNTQAVFTVPANVGSGKVTVKTPYGTAVSTQDVLVAPSGIAVADIVQSKRLVLNEAAQGFSVSATGQYAAALFDGTMGQYLSAQFTSISVASINWSLYGTDNVLLTSGTATPTSPSIHLPKVPDTGTYLLLMKPVSGPATWNLAIENELVVVDGSTLSVATTVPGQSKRLSFVATAGQNLGLGLSDLVITAGTGSYVNVKAYNPDGLNPTGSNCYPANGCDLNLANLAAGTYSVLVTPASSSQAMSFVTTLSSDVTGTLAQDTVTNLSLARRGQNGRLTFAGTAGETVALQIAGQTTVPASQTAYYTIYKPDGTTLTSTDTTSAATLNLSNLPATGNYTVFVDPYYGETLTAQLTLATGTTSGTVLNGASGSFATTVPGQSVYLTFTATAGQNLGLGLSDLLITAGTGTYVDVRAYKPDGTSLTSSSCYPSYGGCDLNLTNLAAGTYSVIVAPTYSDQTMSFATTLSSDVTGTLAQDTVTNLSLARRGQNGRLTFAGTAGEPMMVQIADQTTAPSSGTAYYYVYNPDGTLLTSTTATSTKTLNILPATTGNYTVFVDPTYGETLTAELMLAAGMTGEIVVNGASGSFATTVPGQNVYLTFVATAGQNLGLGLSDLMITAGTTTFTTFDVTPYKPDGTSLTGSGCYLANNGCDLNLANLVAGTYSVIVKPGDSDQTISFTTTLSSDVTGTLTQNTAMNLSLAQRGQNGRLTFAGTAGGTVALQIAGQTTVPASRSVYYYIYKPDGTALGSTNTTSATTLNLSNLPTTGNYTVFVDPFHGETLTAQLTLATSTTSEMALNGANGSFATTLPGQNVYLTFVATAGQNLGLGLSDLVITAGTGNRINVTAYKPDGTSLTSDNSCYATNNGCDLNLTNLAAGTYSVIVAPGSTDQTMSFATTLSSEVTGTLAQNTAMNLSLGRRGQNGRLTFAGTAGETVALQVESQTTVPASRTVYYTTYKPDGTLWTGTYVTSAATLNLSNLPTTGNYTVFVDPYYGETLTVQLTLDTTP